MTSDSKSAAVPISDTSAERLPRQGVRRHRKFLIAAAAVVVAVGVVAALVNFLPDERRPVLLDLAVAVGVIFGLWCGARTLIVGEAARRSRLVAVELIGVTFGGAALGTLVVTLSDRPLGPAKIPALLVIQTLGAVGGAIVAFGIAFFVAAATKGAALLFGRQRPEAEGAFIGVAAGAIGGGVIGAAAEWPVWLPFIAAIVCGLSAFRGVVLYQRCEAAERQARDEARRG